MILCIRCGDDVLTTGDIHPADALCWRCMMRAGAGQGDGQAVLTAARGCRDMLRESAKQFRLLGDQGHAKMADIHAEQACAAIPHLEALLAERAESVSALTHLERKGSLVRSDICDQDTGWFYAFASALDRARALLAKLRPEGEARELPGGA